MWWAENMKSEYVWMTPSRICDRSSSPFAYCSKNLESRKKRDTNLRQGKTYF